MSDPDRYTMPGEPPTDEDLRHEVELSRQELGDTLAQLMSKVDVPSRVRAKMDDAKETARANPLAIGGVAAVVSALIVLWLWLRR
jgi:hypothetical protein